MLLYLSLRWVFGILGALALKVYAAGWVYVLVIDALDWLYAWLCRRYGRAQ